MALKHCYLIVDTETTIEQTVADFGAVIIDRQGYILEQFGVLLDGHFGTLDLWHDKLAPAESFWSSMKLHRRKKHYNQKLSLGQRSICSPQLVNLWLTRVQAQYDPIVTAYNIAFDWGKCANTGIDLGIFKHKFCLMKKAKTFFMGEEYIEFCHKNGFLTPTGRPSTTADTMAKYILGTDLADEPHTALEDARDYEAPILAKMLSKLSRDSLLAL
jgi:hypothetical protein